MSPNLRIKKNLLHLTNKSRIGNPEPPKSLRELQSHQETLLLIKVISNLKISFSKATFPQTSKLLYQ